MYFLVHVLCHTRFPGIVFVHSSVIFVVFPQHRFITCRMCVWCCASVSVAIPLSTFQLTLVEFMCGWWYSTPVPATAQRSNTKFPRRLSVAFRRRRMYQYISSLRRQSKFIKTQSIINISRGHTRQTRRRYFANPKRNDTLVLPNHAPSRKWSGNTARWLSLSSTRRHLSAGKLKVFDKRAVYKVAKKKQFVGQSALAEILY